MTKLPKHRMGTCCSRCCSVIRARSNPSVRFKHLEDSENLISFETVEEISPVMPKSISSWLSRVRNRFSLEEELELQEKSAVEARKEALRIQELRSNSEIINPAQLAYDNTALWLGESISKSGIADHDYVNDLSEQHPGPSGTRNKEFDFEISPQSSVDLEWENENGLSPLTHVPCSTDTTSDTASCLSRLSTPLSNGNAELEWDGHFTNTEINNLDDETEHSHLLREIEQLTAKVVSHEHLDR